MIPGRVSTRGAGRLGNLRYIVNIASMMNGTNAGNMSPGYLAMSFASVTVLCGALLTGTVLSQMTILPQLMTTLLSVEASYQGTKQWKYVVA